MNKITSITRNSIFSLLTNEDNGYDFLLTKSSFCYFGKLNCPVFLSRLYDLQNLPSYDSRVNNAYDDIYLHTVTNPSDYSYEWLFSDERLPLVKGTDEQLLDFLCEMFHPEVRNNSSNWQPIYSRLNELIKADGYEFCIKEIISNTVIYGWRTIASKYSNINKEDISLLMSIFNRGGHVLNFTSRAFDDFTQGIVGLKLVEYYSLSKGKSLQKFIDEAKASEIEKILVALFDEYMKDCCYDGEKTGTDFEQRKSIVEHWRLGISAYTKISESLEQRFSSEYMTAQISLMQSMVKENPTESIGKAKELIESCCKTILDERSQDYSRDSSLTALVKQCTKLLKITPEDIDETIPEAKTMKAILGNLSAIADGIAKLRNTYGSGHGKPATYKGLEERHAKLAMGSCITLVDFLWCSHERTPM